MTYVDGFVFAVPTANKEKLREHALQIDPLFIEYGALKVVECWEDDVPEGEVTSFPLAVKRQEGEAICFSWVIWPSKEVRDGAIEKMMADPRMEEEGSKMPFDGKRMIFGGFQPLVELSA
ncbi:DUF1428 domain-containing protein [Parvularcula sp. IMCC14364]|uniref:DUF1428 domain-containing protein n=1 Tax=Parvularcula sp. IMCC14364 TaxID=3067902 RepID=UPI002740C8C8|nr:DUF1428 domain-containing protein [Parvularcula sp. IMCC14364]